VHCGEPVFDDILFENAGIYTNHHPSSRALK